jgi:hypothetical protein
MNGAELIILSHFQAEKLLNAKREGKVFLSTSPDLGVTKVDVEIGEDGVQFPDGPCLA